MFRFKFSLSSFRLCRRKTTSSTPTHFYSPINSKALEIAYPTIPSPPPTTPSHPPHLSNFKSKSKTTPVSLPTPVPVSFHEDSSRDHRNPMKKKSKKQRKKMGYSCNESDCFSNSEGEAESRSGNSDDYSLGEYVKNAEERRKWMVYVKNAEERRKWMVMKESLAVEKWSEEPYEDFKRSMLEMILEKEMFEAKDLVQLLQCFLSLNSRHHHADIVAAFTEIWELLFL